MAKPIKDTPILYGEEAKRFLRKVARNAKRDHTAEYLRAKAVYDKVNGNSLSIRHAAVAQ